MSVGEGRYICRTGKTCAPQVGEGGKLTQTGFWFGHQLIERQILFVAGLPFAFLFHQTRGIISYLKYISFDFCGEEYPMHRA